MFPFGQHKSCHPCSNWGQKDHGTVKVDAAALADALGKENIGNPNVMIGIGMEKVISMIQEELIEKEIREQWEWEQNQQAELKRREEACQAELKRREEDCKMILQLRVQYEQERQEAEVRRRDAERRRLQLEQEDREEASSREEQERQRKAKELEEQERQFEAQRQEEARFKKLQEVEDQKEIQIWLQANGFKGLNDLVRKKLSKVAPLQCAIQQNNAKMLRLLLQNGANSSKVNSNGESALTVAQKLDKKGSHAAAVQALMTYDIVKQTQQ